MFRKSGVCELYFIECDNVNCLLCNVHCMVCYNKFIVCGFVFLSKKSGIYELCIV